MKGDFYRLARKIVEKPPRVVLFKVKQAAKLFLHRYSRLWAYWASRASQRWTCESVAQLATHLRDCDTLLLNTQGLEATRKFLHLHPNVLSELQSDRDEISQGRITIFGEKVAFQKGTHFPWHTDWRNGHTWPIDYFRNYDFYEFDKAIPYDVKFPWELSRLNFLTGPSLLAVLTDDDKWWSFLEEILSDWQRHNPVAYSINWRPMECSMRAINLVLLFMLALQAQGDITSVLRRLLWLCELHGRFIFRTLEFTDIRGNHYAANLAALTLLGLLLKQELPEANCWLDYSHKNMDSEVLLQFTEDGVQFEKSIPYHRLVTQLFLVSLIARERAGLPVSPSAKYRLKLACKYVKAYTRPDGFAPMWGDNDDATVLRVDHRALRDHRGLIQLAAAYLEDDSLVPQDSRPAIEVPLLLGRFPPESPSQGKLNSESTEVLYFHHGGMVCALNGLDHFIADVGEVGLKGRGGHGHLDATSFELTLRGIPLIVDPGSYIYTGDPVARNRFRSTRAHNVVQVDRLEMGTLFPTHMWQLGDEAQPYKVRCASMPDGFVLAASHGAYTSLLDPVGYRRVWRYQSHMSRLYLADQFKCQAVHNVQRFFHFSQRIKLTLLADTLELASETGHRFRSTWNKDSRARLETDWLSEHYGQNVHGMTLVLEDTLTPEATCLFFVIEPLDGSLTNQGEAH